MKRPYSFLFFIFLLIIPLLAIAQAIIPFGFWHQRILVIPTATQTLYPNVCSTAVTVQTYRGGKANNAQVVTTIDLTATAGTIGFYSDAACTTSITSVSVAANASSATFYIMPTAVGPNTFTVTSNGYQKAEQSNSSNVNPYVWTGSLDNDWGLGGNWSGGTPPDNTQVAYFDNNCVNCNPALSTDTNVGGVKVMGTFAGSINQGAFTLTMQARGWVQLGGTFNGDTGTSKTVDVRNGPFYLGGGTYTATAGTTLSGIYWVLAGAPTFNHSNGTVSFASAYSTFTVVPGTVTYRHVQLTGHAPTINLTGTMTVSGNFTNAQPHLSSCGAINGGQIDLSGDFIVANGCGSGGTTIVHLIGTVNQKIENTSTASPVLIPGLTINSSANVSFIGEFISYGDYTVVAGTVIPGTSSLTIETGYQARTITLGPETYYNFGFRGANSSLNVVNTLKVANDLTVNTYNAYNLNFTSGTIEVSKDVYILGYGFRGAGTLKLVGTTNQKIDASAASPATQRANLPNVTIDNTGGNTISLLGTMHYGDHWIVNSGSVDGGTSSLNTWGNTNAHRTFTPGVGSTYHDLDLRADANRSVSITDNLTVTGNLSLGWVGNNNVEIHMPTPGAGYTLSVAGTLTVRTGTTLNLYGATKTEGTLVNNGSIVP